MSDARQNPYLLTLPQLISAKNKIGRVAEIFDPMKYSLQGFGSQALTPTEFREQLRRSFRVNLTNAELGAIIRLFDKDGDEMVDSVEFLNEFFKLGKQERRKVTIRAKERADFVTALKDGVEKKKLEHAARLAAIDVAATWSEEDERSALKKLTKVAFSYNSVRGFLNPGVTVLGAFTNPQSLSPQEFKEQIRRNFDIQLSPQEAGALVHYFDDDGNGEIDAQEFLNNFFHLRRLEIDRHFSSQLNLTKKQQGQRERRKQIREERFANMRIPRQVECTEEERKSALDKILRAACFKRPNVFIKAIEKSFESSDLSPSEFKEMLKNNFEIRLTAGELNAAIQIFDVDNDGTISCAEFMNTFYKMGAKEQTRQVQLKKDRIKDMHDRAQRRQKREEVHQLKLCSTRIKWPYLPPVDDLEGDEDSTFAGSSSSSSSSGTSLEGTITSTDLGDGTSLDGMSTVSGGHTAGDSTLNHSKHSAYSKSRYVHE
jgi:Ca2+-binding EF-hand superfamily protein